MWVKETVWTRGQADRLEDYGRHAQHARGKGHCDGRVIKLPSWTELHNSVKAKAVSNLTHNSRLDLRSASRRTQKAVQSH